MRLSYLKRCYPDWHIRVDYNQGLRGESAVDQVLKLDAYAPEFIEQPVAASDFTGMARIREAIQSPLLADESVFSYVDMMRAIDEKICDGVSIKIMKSGGMIEGMRIAEAAGKVGMPAYGGDMFETGLAHLAGIHMMAASPNISLGCEFYHSTYYVEEDLLVEPIPIINGMVQVSDKPGLGIDVNPDRLEKCSRCK